MYRWHGASDTRAAPDAAYLAMALPDCRATTWPDAAHLAVVSHWEQVLDALPDW